MFDLGSGIKDYHLETYYNSDGSEGRRGIWIVDKDMTVTVPAGTFDDCIMCQVTESANNGDTGSNIVYSYWFAPHVGMVKMTTIIMVGGSSPIDIWVNELASYTVTGE